MDGQAASTDSLLARLRAGDEAAFDQLVREFGPRMYATIRRILRNDEDAADALQEAFLSASKALGGFRGDAKLSTWLHRIAVNAALMRQRRQRPAVERDIDELLPHFDQGGHFERLPLAWIESADRELEREQLRALVRRTIDELPQTHRNVLLLRDIEELSGAETAAQLGISENAVKVRLHRARQALRELLAPALERT
jgi:RNA polymerase sigma-70 factor (ECF subfamily)